VTTTNTNVEREERRAEAKKADHVAPGEIEIADMGAASDKTMGFFGAHAEFGFPPFNQHP